MQDPYFPTFIHVFTGADAHVEMGLADNAFQESLTSFVAVKMNQGLDHG
jgi:hypothetical protein